MSDDKALTPIQEESITAWRPRRPTGDDTHPAWMDLTPEEREEAFEATLVQRELESLLDGEGLNSTVRAVLSRIRRASTEE
jgi:hypothetical protein